MVEILFRRRSAPYRLRNGLTTYERNGSNKQSISEQEKTTALKHVLADDAPERAAIEGKIYEPESRIKRTLLGVYSQVLQEQSVSGH